MFYSGLATICDALNFDFFIGPPWKQNSAGKVHFVECLRGGKPTLTKVLD